MSIIRDISVMWTLIHTLILFILLFESRYTGKKKLVLILATMGPLILVNFAIFLVVGADKYSSLMLLTLSLPSMVAFWYLAKNRDGRFFFTFCLVDTIVLEITYLTQIIDNLFMSGNLIFAGIVRLVIYPVLEWIVYKNLREVYLDVQRNAKKGWGNFAVISAIFYVTIILHVTLPTPIIDRPEALPVAFLLFVLMPTIYIHIIATMRKQQMLHEMTEQENILQLQVSNLTARMEEFSAADDKFRMERHNFRHKLKTIASLVKTEQYEECLTLLSEYEEALDKTKIRRYCQHPILDAVLSSYIQKAKDKGIPVEMGFAFPDEIPMSGTELATAIANALENAIDACEHVEESKRYIEIKVLDHPRFMIQIANSYTGKVEFDEKGIPVNGLEDHGFGTRFIAAFCEKNGGFYQFRATENRFSLYLNF